MQLDSRSVSRLHALIQKKDAGDFQLVDLGSRNGSFVNGRRVSLPIVLQNEDRLAFGDQELAFHGSGEGGKKDAGSDTRSAPTTALHSSRLATILVVDIRDFTPLARTIPEALLAETIGTWFLRTRQIVQGLGSWAQKYIGDAVMAVWAHDDPQRVRQELVAALSAAAQIEAATTEISSALRLPFALRVGAGLNTGSAILGGDYTALGEAVNAAFRLETATKRLGGGVMLGDASFRELALPGPAPFIEQEVELKGYDGPSIAWSVTFDGLRRFLAPAA